MSNLMDYLDWRGDLTFREAPFNEVDNLILAQLVYVEFAGIVPAPGEEGTITVKEACELFFAAHDRKEIMERVSMTKTAAFVLEKMAQTERFCNAQLFGYINDISKEEQSQFSVVCVRLDDKSIYVSFSGTDNTIVGWRENFGLSVRDTGAVESCRLSESYRERGLGKNQSRGTFQGWKSFRIRIRQM